MTNATINQSMYGFTEIDGYFESVKNSINYKMNGANIVIADLMSEAQEQIAHGLTEQAHQTLNLAKALIFQVVDGKLF